MSETLPSPYAEPELYDLLFEDLDFDVPTVLRLAREGAGPVLDVGCGTGRILLRLLAAGIDADGLEPAAPMLARLREKARERGLLVRAQAGDMRGFSSPRPYARVFCLFNAFSHMLTLDDQLAALRTMLAHTAPGGAVVVHQSQLAADVWLGQDGERVREHSLTLPGGDTITIDDTRTKDRSRQRQHSIVDIEVHDAQGRLIRSHRSETEHRWLMPNEFELLLRHAGATRVELRGDGAEGPVTPATGEMWAFAWNEARA